jgi:hypothetical protein
MSRQPQRRARQQSEYADALAQFAAVIGLFDSDDP